MYSWKGGGGGSNAFNVYIMWVLYTPHACTMCGRVQGSRNIPGRVPRSSLSLLGCACVRACARAGVGDPTHTHTQGCCEEHDLVADCTRAHAARQTHTQKHVRTHARTHAPKLVPPPPCGAHRAVAAPPSRPAAAAPRGAAAANSSRPPAARGGRGGSANKFIPILSHTLAHAAHPPVQSPTRTTPTHPSNHPPAPHPPTCAPTHKHARTQAPPPPAAAAKSPAAGRVTRARRAGGGVCGCG